MKNLIVSILLFLLTVSVSTVHGQTTGTATLSWDSNTEADLAGYRVYQSQVSGLYNGLPVADIPSVAIGTPTFQISALKEDQTYFWVITAYDTSGNESGFSNEVTKTISVPPNAPSGLTITIKLNFPVVP